MVKLTLKQCAYLVAVADHGGIAQASRSLHISQPAVAQAIDKLEATWNLKFFIRHHARGTELTPQGRAFVTAARRLLQQARQTENAARSIADGLAGTVRFGCFHTVAPFYLAQLINGCSKAFPEIRIQARELLQTEIIAALEVGELDLALTYDLSLNSPVLESRILARLKPFVLLSEGHPLARQASLSLVDMADEDFIMFDGPSSREYFEGILRSSGIDPPIAYYAKSMESVRSAVANGLGFSLSVMRLEHSISHDSNQVASIPLEDDLDPLAIVLVRRKEAAESKLIENFSEYCQTHFFEVTA